MFQCSIILVVQGALVLICFYNVIYLGFLSKFLTCILLNKIVDNKINTIYTTFLLFEHITVRILYLDSMFDVMFS